MELPMTALTLGGNNGSVSLEIAEVFGFPDQTDYGGGYGAYGLLRILTETIRGEHSLSAKHWFTTGELNRFEKELARCYETLSGTATLENCENELELTLSVGKTGHVTIVGKYQEFSEFDNVLHFQIESDQTYIPEALSQLRHVREVFGDHAEEKSTMQTADQVVQALEAAGFKAAFLPISAMEQVKEHYDTLERRAPETGTAKAVAEHFRSNQPPKLEFEPQSILVIALPPGQAGKLVLARRGGRVEVPILPFHPNGEKPEERLKELLAGVQLGHTRGISQKLLVALSGLGQYGRNNICFVGDWGTHCGLDALYTDISYEGPVYPDVRMKACEGCSLCRVACPTGAIGERQVIDANRCLTMRNENPGRVPRWVPKSAHHVLIGCARCQECCPMNPKLDYDSHVLMLDKAETRRLLSPGKKCPKALEQKLRAFGLDDWHLRLIKRNARLVVEAKEA